jgi:hypothetical protein
LREKKEQISRKDRQVNLPTAGRREDRKEMIRGGLKNFHA